jgi:hypothetical protein
MENFILWNSDIDLNASQLSFFATRIQLPCINEGTRNMIDKMLSDLGIKEIEYDGWSVDYFLNNYYSSPEELISYDSVWSDTWKISLHLIDSPRIDLASADAGLDIRRTFAHDGTWKGGSPSQVAKYIIVAEFYNQDLFSRAITALKEVSAPSGIIDPELQDLIDRVKEHPLSRNIYISRRVDASMKLVINLGTFTNESFTEYGGDLAERVSELIHDLGASITWDEKASYLM